MKLCNKIYYSLFFTAFFFFISCSDFLQSPQVTLGYGSRPDFYVSNLCIKNDYDEDACVLGGVYFDFFNKSEKEIIAIELNIRIFNRQTGKPAFAGAGTIKVNYVGSIQSLEKREMCLSLDDYISYESQDNLIIDAFIISKITYSDQSIWKDYFGVYGFFPD